MRKILVIVGPTAVGKSALAVLIARRFNGEVISADSRQVYKKLDIGSGKITKEEMRGIPHHLLDVLSPKEQFTVAEFRKLAQKEIDEIYKRGKLPIVVGGTGLYIDTLLNETTIPEVPPNPKLRKELEKKTAKELFSILKGMDAERAKTIDAKNPRRLVRAIEIAAALGRVPLRRNTPQKDVNPLFIGLTLPAEDLKKRISVRLFARIGEQMIQEVRALHENGLTWKRMDALGLEYRYISRHLRGLITKDEMIGKLKTEIWRYAKRQMTWFKRDKRIKWFSPYELAKIENEARNFLRS